MGNIPKKYIGSLFLFSALIFIFVFFQNCSNIHLSAPGVAETSSVTPPPPAPTTQTITMQPGYTGVTEAPPMYSLCPLNGTNWWPGSRTQAVPGGGTGLQCRFSLSATTYFTFKFHTPTLDEAQSHTDATIGNLVLNNAFFAISDTPPSQNQSATIPTNCISGSNVFINWVLDGSNSSIVSGRTDVCVLQADKDYWVTVAQPQAVDPNAAASTCTGDSGQTCSYAFEVNEDAIIVNEGYDQKPTCVYQPNDPIFATSTMMAARGIGSDGQPGIEPNLKTVATTPMNYGFSNVVNAAIGDMPSTPAPELISLDMGVLNPSYFSKPTTQGTIVALKFHTPKFGENAAWITHELGIEAGYQSSVGPYTAVQSISECPGDFDSSPSVGMRLIMSGYNSLQANGHYINVDMYTMPWLASGRPSGSFQTTPSPVLILKPDTDYYYNFKAPSGGCMVNGYNPSLGQAQYCATGRTNEFSPATTSSFGRFFFMKEQH